MNKYLTLSLIAAGLSVSAAGFAAGDNDADHKADSQAMFNKLDADGDGQLTAAEMTGLPGAMKQQKMAKVDTNQDGKIDKSEFEARARQRADRMFARMDKNSDGQISADEMTMPRGRHHNNPPAGHMPSPPPHGDKGDAPKPPKFDANTGHDNSRHHGDHRHGWHRRHGKPSTDEIFAHMDGNGDGYVSASEWDNAVQQWHHHHGHPKPAPDQS